MKVNALSSGPDLLVAGEGEGAAAEELPAEQDASASTAPEEQLPAAADQQEQVNLRLLKCMLLGHAILGCFNFLRTL